MGPFLTRASNKTICYCKNVPEHVIVNATKNGANTLAAIKKQRELAQAITAKQ